MRQLKPFLALFFSACFLSCSGDGDDCETTGVEFPNEKSIDAEIYKKSKKDCRISRLQNFKINGLSGGTVHTEKGVWIEFFEESFLEEEIEIEVLELLSVGELAACQVMTNAVTKQQLITPSLSEGVLYVNASFEGKPIVFNREIWVYIPSGNRNLQLRQFRTPSCVDLTCDPLWEIDPFKEVVEFPYTDAGGVEVEAYLTIISESGWFSLARFEPEDKSVKNLFHKTPSEYSLENSNVFFAFDNPSMALTKMTGFDSDLEIFYLDKVEVPLEKEGALFFVAKPDESFRFEGRKMKVEEENISVTTNPKSGTEEELINYLNTL